MPGVLSSPMPDGILGPHTNSGYAPNQGFSHHRPRQEEPCRDPTIFLKKFNQEIKDLHGKISSEALKITAKDSCEVGVGRRPAVVSSLRLHISGRGVAKATVGELWDLVSRWEDSVTDFYRPAPLNFKANNGGIIRYSKYYYVEFSHMGACREVLKLLPTLKLRGESLRVERAKEKNQKYGPNNYNNTQHNRQPPPQHASRASVDEQCPDECHRVGQRQDKYAEYLLNRFDESSDDENFEGRHECNQYEQQPRVYNQTSNNDCHGISSPLYLYPYDQFGHPTCYPPYYLNHHPVPYPLIHWPWMSQPQQCGECNPNFAAPHHPHYLRVPPAYDSRGYDSVDSDESNSYRSFSSNSSRH